MADVAADLKTWSTTAASNSPSGGSVIGAGLDDNLREIQKVVRQDLASKGADIASSTTADVGAVAGFAHDITGTTTITGLGTVSAGIPKVLKFEGALTLTHNATSLILPGGANIVTADGDIGYFISEGSGNWRCIAFFKAATGAWLNVNGATEDTAPDLGADFVFTYDVSTSLHKKVLVGRLGAGVSGTEQATTSGTEKDFTGIPAWAKKIIVQFNGVSTNGTSHLLVQLGDSGGVEVTGYSASSSGLTTTVGTDAYTAGFGIRVGDAAALVNGSIILSLEDASDFTWVAQGLLVSSTPATYTVAGVKALSAALDRVRITTVNGTDAFDAGAVNILYE